MPRRKTKKSTLLEQFAPMIGGVDDEGIEHKLSADPSEKDAKRKQHLFWVRNLEDEYPRTEFVLGDQVKSFVKEGRWTAGYIGRHKDCYRGKKVINKELQKLMLQQIDEIIEAKRAKDERLDNFYDDEHYEEMKEAQYALAKERFSEKPAKKAKAS